MREAQSLSAVNLIMPVIKWKLLDSEHYTLNLNSSVSLILLHKTLLVILSGLTPHK